MMSMGNDGMARDKNLFCRLALIAALAVSVSFIPYAAMRFAGLYINLTGSMARGIWKAYEIPIGTPLKGEAVIVKRGDLPSDRRLVKSEYLLKRVAAVEGDIVDYNAANERVCINGTPLPNSKIFLSGKNGITLPHPEYPYAVPKDCVYLSSEHIYGYDSRYFGPAPLCSVIATARPVWCR